jgi:hypothetical protein
LGCYYVNIITHSVQRQCNPLNAISLAALGYFGRDGLPAGAFNAFPTFDEAKAFAAGVGAATGGGSPGSSPGGGGGSGGSGTGDSGQSDWTHLIIRVAEFAIGAILVYIGFNAIVERTKGYQKIETIVTGVGTNVGSRIRK